MPRKKTFQWHADGETDAADTPSRSARKRQSTALQKLGEQLTQLDASARAALPLSADLAEALRLYDRIRDKEGRRRQLQYIGRLMREIDAGPLEAALAARTAAHQADTALLHRAEQWRAALLDAADPARTMERLGERREFAGRLRLIPFSSVGGTGLLLAVRPDRITIDGAAEDNILIAVTPNSLSAFGAYHAIY